MLSTTPVRPPAHPAATGDHLGILVVVTLLILTAWGSAVALFLVSAFGLAALLVATHQPLPARSLYGIVLAALLALLLVALWGR